MSWVTITSGSSGTGNGAVSYTVQANMSSTARTGTLTIAGQTYVITQSGALAVVSCGVSVPTVLRWRWKGGRRLWAVWY